MKRALSILGQFVLFFAVFLAGTLLDPFHLKWFVTQVSRTSTRYFVPDGLILCVILYLLILGVEAARKRLRGSGAATTLAFILAIALGFLSKFGMATHDLF
jgi:hypothetical protein